MNYYLGVDLGASSGRVMLAHLQNGMMQLEEIHRFANAMIPCGPALTWDVVSLFKEILRGMKKCREIGKIPVSVAIDSWAVDYALLDENDCLLGPVYAYRDERGKSASRLVHAMIPFSKLYQETGIQYQPFNTIYQLYDDEIIGRLAKASSFLMIPEYFEFLLTGIKKKEYTNATSTGLVKAVTKKWDREIIDKLGLPKQLFAEEPIAPPFLVGPLQDAIAKEVGYQCQVVMVASHDTASSVVALPSLSPCTFLSSGTWSLLGTELASPLISNDGEAANFTNEGGVGSIRFLKNITGLWLAQCLQKEFHGVSFVEMGEKAAARKGFNYRLNLQDERYFLPSNVASTIRKECQERGYPIPRSLGGYAYAIYCSLANEYAEGLRAIKAITGIDNPELYVVGGGNKNHFLNSLIEEKTGKKVILGSSEATVLGNVAMQALALKELPDFMELKKAIIGKEEK